MSDDTKENPILRIFERVRDHLLTQNRPSSSIGEGCLYRLECMDASKPPLRCAVGCLITDEAYDAAIEGRGLSSLTCVDGRWVAVTDCEGIDDGVAGKDVALARALKESNVPATDDVHQLLIELQQVHDWIEPDKWKEVLGTSPRGLHQRILPHL